MMADINLVHAVHVKTALISISGFIFRGVLRFRGSDMVDRKWLKITPHVNDTILIVSAVLLLNQYGLNPLQISWLQAKLVALLIYISLGFIAFRFGRTRSIRLVSWCAAILVFCYIVAVAVTKNPWLVHW